MFNVEMQFTFVVQPVSILRSLEQLGITSYVTTEMGVLREETSFVSRQIFSKLKFRYMNDQIKCIMHYKTNVD